MRITFILFIVIFCAIFILNPETRNDLDRRVKITSSKFKGEISCSEIREEIGKKFVLHREVIDLPDFRFEYFDIGLNKEAPTDSSSLAFLLHQRFEQYYEGLKYPLSLIEEKMNSWEDKNIVVDIPDTLLWSMPMLNYITDLITGELRQKGYRVQGDCISSSWPTTVEWVELYPLIMRFIYFDEHPCSSSGYAIFVCAGNNALNRLSEHNELLEALAFQIIYSFCTDEHVESYSRAIDYAFTRMKIEINFYREEIEKSREGLWVMLGMDKAFELEVENYAAKVVRQYNMVLN